MAKEFTVIATRKNKRKIQFEFDLEQLEAFCRSSGILRKSFLNMLKKSEKEHKKRESTPRRSLNELLVSGLEVLTTRTFDKLFKKLPKHVQVKAVKASDQFQKNPFYPGLRLEKLSPGKLDVWSIRTDRNYRIILRFLGKEKALFLYIGHHKDIYDYDFFFRG